MKKDNVRDYATEAFRYYAVMGKPTRKSLERKILENISDRELRAELKGTIKNTDIYSPVENAILENERIFLEMKCEFLDLLAVEATIRELEQMRSGQSKIDILNELYFKDADKPIRRGDFSNKVQRTSLTFHIGEASIYRILKEARLIFAEKRNLRVN